MKKVILSITVTYKNIMLPTNYVTIRFQREINCHKTGGEA